MKATLFLRQPFDEDTFDAGIVGPGLEPLTARQSTTRSEAENLYSLLRSGSLVIVRYPADLVVIGRFLSLCEAGADTGEAAASVLDLIAHGCLKVEVTG